MLAETRPPSQAKQKKAAYETERRTVCEQHRFDGANTEGGECRVDKVGEGGAKAGRETHHKAPFKGAPHAQEGDRPNRYRQGETDGQSPDQPPKIVQEASPRVQRP
jgi:hypothetical protein